MAFLVHVFVKILDVFVALEELPEVDVSGKVEDATGGLCLDLVVGKVLLEELLHVTKLLVIKDYIYICILCHSHLRTEQLIYISALSKLREISAIQYTNLNG